jgi:thiamine pyrophosphokinase
MYDDYSKIFCLPKQFDKWYTAATPISLLPVGRVEGVVTSGLKYDLNNDFLEMGIRTGSSNEAMQDGTVKIAYQSGTLMLMECHD